MAELIDIEGISPEEAELLEATGWSDVQALAQADVDLLEREMSAANQMLKLVARTPERKKIERWIAAASRALDPATSRKRESKGKIAAPPAPAADSPDLPVRPKRRKGRKTQESAPETALSESDSAPPAPVDDHGESALIAQSGPVNFEADPDVSEMLASAPIALPIPARTLAEKGIAPSEIAVAPLLNRALGDLEVRISVERPQRKDLPDAPAGSRRSQALASVQVSDVGFTSGRRGFDASRVRTIEEAQGDAPPVRAATTSPGVEDDRITLLRAPRPETNAGRKPGSRFYIRGVLHDRPLKVWFGGLFAILLQLSVPLAILSAPLLILSDQMPDNFDWVPGWIIAFPIMVPVIGILYALVSTGAKCRVCAQRMYVPKHCLKNRKAHHLPLLGHIGAVALHVMTFKWFNCTFCGTSIRIKK